MKNLLSHFLLSVDFSDNRDFTHARFHCVQQSFWCGSERWDSGADLEFNRDAPIDLSSCEIVRNGILLSGNVRYPIVGIDIVDAEEVQKVYSKPDVLEDSVAAAIMIEF